MDVGLHLNLDETFTSNNVPAKVSEPHQRIRRFLKGSRYSQLVFNPALQNKFNYVFNVQFEEFVRLYGRVPTHVDGHHHMHLCSNMLFGGIIPQGVKVRGSFQLLARRKNRFEPAVPSPG